MYQTQRSNTNRIAISGFSAGANLALVTASKLRDNLRRDPVLKKVTKPTNPFPVFFLRLFATCYIPKVEQRKDPIVSLVFADPAFFSS
ncbi:60S ribosomal protein L27a [Fusarium oxysporum f. sp. albedinis]|nr:60S ribosomal protein L27a [Fusarium oxysporum f. sp. albedinis]